MIRKNLKKTNKPVGAGLVSAQNSQRLTLNNVGVAWYATQKGITLIALIITIIVLLILAGVSLNLAIGENGIFKTAEKAALLTKIKEVEEQANMFYATRKAQEYAGGKEATFAGVISDLKAKGYTIEELKNDQTGVKGITLSVSQVNMDIESKAELAYTIVYEEGGASYFVKIQGNSYEIKEENGGIIVSEEATKVENSDSETTTEEIIAECNVANLVTIEIAEDKIKLTSLKTTGEGKITITETSSGKIAECTLTVEYLPFGTKTEKPEGKSWDLTKVDCYADGQGNIIPVPKGFIPLEGTKSTGFVIKNSTDSNEFVWVPVEGMGYTFNRYAYYTQTKSGRNNK